MRLNSLIFDSVGKGDIWVTNNENIFSFQLEEVLSFERGQEVGDMISVFLDPEITVQSLKEDVSIRGMIELQGEYERTSDHEDQPERVLNAETFEQRHYVDKVVDIGEERAIFSHQFPVEISVPHYRITNVEEVSMEIEHFDYEIIAPDEMKIQSSILIHGINNEEYVDTSERNDEEREPLFTVVDQDPFVEDEAESHEDSIQMKEQVSRSLATNEAPPAPPPSQDELDEAALRETEEPQEQMEVSTHSIEETETTISSMDEDDHEVDESTAAEEGKIDYLMSMFGDEEENGHTKVRLCIVQERDTVESIAEKYNITKSLIVKRNQLENEELVEGQLLHIPLLKK